MASQLVSVALCTYNGENYLKDQLNSLVNQTHNNCEIIIVDDCSTDNTVEIIKHYQQKYPQIKLFVNSSNLGYTKNFEKAIRLCAGDYIALCDQDDIWDTAKVQTMVELIGDNILAYHDSEFIDEEGNALNKKLSDVRNCYSGNDSRVFLFDNCVLGHATLFKRELLDYIDKFNDLIIHDRWLAYVATNVGSIKFIEQPLVKYRQHLNANTNILGQPRTRTLKKSSVEKLEFQLRVTQIFADYPFSTDSTFKKTLLGLLKQRMSAYTNFSLCFFIFKHRHILFFIQKKRAISKINKIFKFFWGGRIKRLSLFTVYS